MSCSGQWAVVCQNNDHYNGGAKALFNVSQCGLQRDHTIEFAREAVERTYYIQAEEEFWDYAPSGVDLISGQDLADTDQ